MRLTTVKTLFLFAIAAATLAGAAPLAAAKNDAAVLNALDVLGVRVAAQNQAKRLDPAQCRAVERACHTRPKIFIGSPPAGLALKRLAESFDLEPLSEALDDLQLGPMIVGPEDLYDALRVRQIRLAYDAGFTVAVVEALPRHAAQLRSAVGASATCGQPAEGLALFGLQRSAPGRFASRSEYHLRHRIRAFGSSSRLRGGAFARPSPLPDIERNWLSHRFQATPPNSALQGDLCTDPTTCLTQLATSVNCSVLAALTDPDQSIEIENFIWPARDFSAQTDIYYVLQNFLVTASTGNSGTTPFTMTTKSAPAIAGLAGGTIQLIDPSPGQSTQIATTYTSGLTKSIGGSIGTDDLISGEISIDNETSQDIPSTILTYTADLSAASLQYASAVSPAVNLGVVWLSVSTTNQWLWSVPKGAYPAGAVTFPFVSTGALSNFGSTWNTSLDIQVPVPFDTWTLNPPNVTNVVPTTVPPGTLFTISGSGFYPGTVTGVSLGGVSLPSANWIANGASEMTVVAPSEGLPGGVPLPVVVQTQQGVSSGMATVTIGGTAGAVD